MFAKTKTPPSLDTLISDLLARIPDLASPNGPGAEVFRLAKLRDGLIVAKRRISDELATTSADSPLGPGTAVKFDPAADAEALLTGADVATLVSPVAESRWASLHRQRRAVETALELLTDKVREADLTVVASEFEKLKPMIARVMAEIVARYQALAAGLAALNGLDAELGHRGFPIGRRPPLMGGFDLGILLGEQGRPALAWWIENLSKTWGLDKEGK